MSRRPAFDPARLADDLDQLLPPPSPSSGEAPDPAPSSTRTSPPTAPGEDTAVIAGASRSHDARPGSPRRAARGGGGRQRERTGGAEDDSPAVSAVRIPKPLYDAVVHDLLAGTVERPSYAQIVAWTCEDHPDDVLAELADFAARPARAPRGRKLATDGVPLTLRFHSGERRSLDQITARADSESARITRTAVVIAALRVAVKHGLPTTGIAGE
jgi:hypothetical protein